MYKDLWYKDKLYVYLPASSQQIAMEKHVQAKSSHRDLPGDPFNSESLIDHETTWSYIYFRTQNHHNKTNAIPRFGQNMGSRDHEGISLGLESHPSSLLPLPKSVSVPLQLTCPLSLSHKSTFPFHSRNLHQTGQRRKNEPHPTFPFLPVVTRRQLG